MDLPWGDAPTLYTRKARASGLGTSLPGYDPDTGCQPLGVRLREETADF
jgi:hypothetical protein